MKRGRADWFVEPYRAIEIGICDKIGMPKLNINVDVKIDFVVPQ